MPQDLLNIIWASLGTIVTAFIGWGTSLLIAWLNTKIKDEKIRKWVSGIANIISNAVKQIFQEFVEVLKKEGKFDAAKQQQAKEACLNVIRGQLTDDMKKYIEENFGDMEAWLSQQIESTIYNLKNK